MYTLSEYENSMTLFYSKRNGEIKCYSSGIQDMNYFGEDKADYEIIWDFIVKPVDEYVLKNIKLFKIDLETKEIAMIANAIPQYPIAQQ